MSQIGPIAERNTACRFDASVDDRPAGILSRLNARARKSEALPTGGSSFGGRDPGFLLSVVVPCYNEDAGLREFHRRICAALAEIGCCWEIVYVNDGSNDRTLPVLWELHAECDCAGVIDLSRNFGKEVAISAGLENASGDVVVVIDADLQDPPEVIAEMVRKWSDTGCDVVYARRRTRSGETWFKRSTARMFYRVINAVAEYPIPFDSGDFRLLSRRAVECLLQMPERRRFMKGLFAWIGYDQVAIEDHQDRRYAGETKWNYWKLWNFSLEGITSFSTLPLKLSTYLGLAGAVVAIGYAVYMAICTMILGNPVAGYPSLVVFILMMGSIQLIVLGIIGEYISRIFVEFEAASAVLCA